MPDENGTSPTDAQEATVDAAAQAAAGQEQPGAADGQPTDPVADELSKLRKELSETRREAAANRVKLKKYEDEQLTETQRLERERDEAKTRADELEQLSRDLRAQVLAAKVGVRAEAVQDLARLIDWSAIEDPTDDRQVERHIKEMVKEKPYLSQTAGVSLNGGAGRGSNGHPFDMNQWIREAAGR